jgi:hypothetical protein
MRSGLQLGALGHLRWLARVHARLDGHDHVRRVQLAHLRQRLPLANNMFWVLVHCEHSLWRGLSSRLSRERAALQLDLREQLRFGQPGHLHPQLRQQPLDLRRCLPDRLRPDLAALQQSLRHQLRLVQQRDLRVAYRVELHDLPRRLSGRVLPERAAVQLSLRYELRLVQQHDVQLDFRHKFYGLRIDLSDGLPRHRGPLQFALRDELRLLEQRDLHRGLTLRSTVCSVTTLAALAPLTPRALRTRLARPRPRRSARLRLRATA